MCHIFVMGWGYVMLECGGTYLMPELECVLANEIPSTPKYQISSIKARGQPEMRRCRYGLKPIQIRSDQRNAGRCPTKS